MKKLLCILATLALGFAPLALPVAAEDTGSWQEAYFTRVIKLSDGSSKSMPILYALADYNQDGVPELMVDQVLQPTIVLTAVDNRVKIFDARSLGYGFPDGYRNKKTGEIEWYNVTHFDGRDYQEHDEFLSERFENYDPGDPYYLYSSDEFIFDFDTMTATTFPCMRYEGDDPLVAAKFDDARTEWENNYELTIKSKLISLLLNDGNKSEVLWQQLLEAGEEFPGSLPLDTPMPSLFWIKLSVLFSSLNNSTMNQLVFWITIVFVVAYINYKSQARKKMKKD